MKKLLVIVGPTAVGKTKLSLRMASELGGEIISADSRLFYRGMDIGTAKPTTSEQSAVPHHLLDICEPDQTITLSHYQRLAYLVIEDVLGRGQLPILVGGTGQYIMAVIEGWGIPKVAPQPRLRQQLELLGQEELGRWLIALDPEAAEKIDSRNIRRVIRALEVTLVTGTPITVLQRKNPPPYDIFIIGLHRNRESLYSRIDQRVEKMIDDGLADEVMALMAAGYDRSLSSMSGLGYRQIMAYLNGEYSLNDAIERIKFDTHRFARQQNTWFRQDDPRIHWFDLDEEEAQAAALNIGKNWLADADG